jgi:calnexin
MTWQAPKEYIPPAAKNAHFVEAFTKDWRTRWQTSKHSKFAEGEWEVGPGPQQPGIPGDEGLLVRKEAKHHAISAAFSEPLDLSRGGKDLVVQYEVRLNKPHTCGGAYLKLLAHPFAPENFSNDSPYIVMFGPDKCGTNDKVHFIFRHQNPISKQWEEKHLKSPPRIKGDRSTHLYTLAVRHADNSFEMLIDGETAMKGFLLEDFQPPVNPPKMIDDPTDKRPADWVTEAKIPDPAASKPADWDESAPEFIEDEDDEKPAGWLDDEPKMVPDPEATKPADWIDEEDGKWDPPLVENPKCAKVGCGEWKRRTIRNPKHKGKWKAPLIDNPSYKGEWKPRQIANPNFFEDANPARLPAIGGVGFELWTMQDDIQFDNIFIGTDAAAAREYAAKTFEVKRAAEDAANPEKAAASSFFSVAFFARLLDENPVAFVIGALVVVGGVVFVISQVVVAQLSDRCRGNGAGARQHARHEPELEHLRRLQEREGVAEDDGKAAGPQEGDEEEQEEQEEKEKEQRQQQQQQQQQGAAEGEDKDKNVEQQAPKPASPAAAGKPDDAGAGAAAAEQAPEEPSKEGMRKRKPRAQ